MSENEKQNEAEKEKENSKEKAEGEAGENAGKKNKMILIAGIGGVVLLLLLIGGFVVFKTISAKKQAAMAAAADAGGPTEVGGADPKGQQNGKAEEKKDDHGKPDEKKDDHGKKDEKKDDHGKKDEKKDDHGKKDDKKDDHGKKDDKKEAVKGTQNFGDAFNLLKMDLNLGNPIENRYLRLGVSIEYRGGEEQLAELKQREIQIKDIIITTVTNKTRAQLLTTNGKELLRREILNKINEVADKPVQNVFFTEFLVE